VPVPSQNDPEGLDARTLVIVSMRGHDSVTFSPSGYVRLDIRLIPELELLGMTVLVDERDSKVVPRGNRESEAVVDALIVLMKHPPLTEIPDGVVAHVIGQLAQRSTATHGPANTTY